MGYQQKRRGGQSLFGRVHLDCLSVVSVQLQVPLGENRWLITEECLHRLDLERRRKPPKVEKVLRRAAPTFRSLVVARRCRLITKCPLPPGVFDWHETKLALLRLRGKTSALSERRGFCRALFCRRRILVLWIFPLLNRPAEAYFWGTLKDI